MNEDQTKAWMNELAASGSDAALPKFDQLWTRRQLEEEFEHRRQLVAPLFWVKAAYQSAAGLAFAAAFTWVVELWSG